MTADRAAAGVYPGVSDADYHADKGTLSASGAKLLLPPSTPAHYRWAMENPREPKPAFDFGHLVHKLVLGEGADVAVIDAPDWRGKAAREARDEAYAAGRIPVLQAEFRDGLDMARAVDGHPVAAALFADGDPEVSLYATDPGTGVGMRARPDWMTMRDGRLWLVDLKTSVTAEPAGFARKAADYGYHVQAAWYCHVVRLLELDPSPAFVFVVVEKAAPYLVSVTEFDAEAMETGRVLMGQALRIYRACRDSGQWPGYDAAVTSMSLPPWAVWRDVVGDWVEEV